MGNWIVRNLGATLVQKLKRRAAKHACRAEAKHRAILEAAPGRTHRRCLASVLASMPNVGLDADFEHKREPRAATDVFD